MKIFFCRLLPVETTHFLFGVVLVAAGALHAAEPGTPKTVVKMVVRDISPSVPKDSFAAKPKTLYRSGVGYARLEAPLNPEKKEQLLVIVHEPTIWTIDLVSKTGQILKDTEGGFHVPVWSGATIPEPLEGLEYGMELEFLKKHKAVKTASRSGSILCDSYTLKRSGYEVVLMVKTGTQIPLEIRILKDSKIAMDDYYDSYEIGLPFDPVLFQVPEGVKIESTAAEPDSEWGKFEPEKARCSVLMPGQPKKSDDEMEMWESNDSQGHAFNLSYSDLPGQVTDLEDFFQKIAKGITASQSTIVSQKRLMFEGFPACEFEVKSGNSHAQTRVCLVNQRLYILTCEGDTTASSEEPGKIIFEVKKPAEKFFDSLEFVHPELNQGK